MSSNRYVSIKPQEFQQTYEPFPLQQMMGLAQYKQGREDQINAALGKAAGDAAVEGGLFTQPIAQEITKQRLADIDRLTGMFQDKRDVGSTIRELSKLQQQWKTDPRLSSIESDAALKNTILANMAKPEYGKSLKYTTHDPLTGGFNRNDIEQLVASGHQFTPADYGMIATEGDLKTFSPYIDKIKADQFGDYEIVDGQMKEKTSGAVLDYNTVLQRSLPVLNSFKNDDGTINMQTASQDPNIASLVEWKRDSYAREGREYGWEDLKDDYMNIASLSFNTKLKRDVTGSDTGKGSGDKKDGTGIFDIPVTVKYSVANATNEPATEIKSLSKAAIAVGIDPFTFKDNDTGRSINEMLYTPPMDAQKKTVYDEQYRNTQQDIYNETYKIKLEQIKAKNPPREINGQLVQTMDLVDMQQQARNETEALLMKRRKLAAAKYEADFEASTDTTILKPGDSKSSIEILKKSESEKNDKLIDLTEQAFKKIVGLPQKEGELFFKEHSYLANAIAHPYYDVTDLRTDEEKARGAIRVNTEYIIKNREKILQDLGGVEQRKIGRPLNKMDKPQQSVNYKQAYEFATKDVERKIAEDSYSKYYDILNKKIEEKFGQQEFTITGYALMSKDGEFSSTEIPIQHKAVITAAIDRIREGAGVFYNGMPVNDINAEGVKNNKGQAMDQLFVAGSKDDTKDFRGGQYIPTKFYYNNVMDKWMASGYFRKNIDGNLTESSMYDVDITPNMEQFFNEPQMMEILADDRAVDIVEGVYRGTSNVAKFGTPDNIKGKYGDIIITMSPTGRYGLSGNYFDAASGSIKTIESKLVEMQLDPSRLSKDQAKQVLSDAFVNQMKYGVDQEKLNLAIPQNIQPIVSRVFETIAGPESSGSYNAMNQGSEDAAGTKPINSTTESRTILSKDLTSMTIKDVMDAQERAAGDPGRIHAAGKYQFIGSTLRGLVNRLDLPLNTKFDAATQNRLAYGLLEEIAANYTTPGAIKSKLKSTWVGLDNLDDQQLNDLVVQVMNIQAYLNNQ